MECSSCPKCRGLWYPKHMLDLTVPSRLRQGWYYKVDVALVEEDGSKIEWIEDKECWTKNIARTEAEKVFKKLKREHKKQWLWVGIANWKNGLA